MKAVKMQHFAQIVIFDVFILGLQLGKGYPLRSFFQNAVIQATLFLIKELDFVDKNLQYLSKF